MLFLLFYPMMQSNNILMNFLVAEHKPTCTGEIT